MNKKRKLLIDTSLELFYPNGINNIGINEILKVSGVAKQTLYSNFESKDMLILAALEKRHESFIEWLSTKLHGAESNEQMIFKLFTGLNSWFTNAEPMLGKFHGCFFINCSAEVNNRRGDISLFCKQHKQAVRETIEQHMVKKDPFLLDAICTMKEGAITSAYVSDDYSVAMKCVQMLNRIDC